MPGIIRRMPRRLGRAAGLGASAPVFNSYAGAQSINADGISLEDNDATVIGWGTSQGADPLADPNPTNNYDPHNNPVTVFVRRPGFTAAGAATHVVDTVTLMSRKRQAAGNETLWTALDTTPDPDEATGMLSDEIFSTDTIYGSDGTEAGITNNSTKAYPPPACEWGYADYRATYDGSLTVRLYVSHRFARSSRPVAAVKFIVKDGSAATKEATVASTTAVLHAGSGYYAPYFEHTFSDLDDLDAGIVTVDAIIYPWAGPAYQLSVDGTGQRGMMNYVQTVLNDHDGSYGQAHAMVDPSSTEASAQVYATEAAMTSAYGSDANTAYATINAAIAAIATFNDTTYSRTTWHDNATTTYVASTDCGGGTVHLQEATYTKVAWPRNQTMDFPVTIQGAAGTTKSSVILNTANSTSNAERTPAKTRLKDLTFNKLNVTDITLDADGTSGNLSADRCLIFDSVTSTFSASASAYAATVFQWHRIFAENCDGVNLNVGGTLSSNLMNVTSIGSENWGTFQAINRIASKLTTDGAAMTVLRQGDAQMVHTYGPRTYGHSMVILDGGASKQALEASANADGDYDDLHLCGSLIESDLASGSGAALSFSADGDEFDCANSLIVACSIVGERINTHYSDTTNFNPDKNCVYRFTVNRSLNSKDDTETTASATRYGGTLSCQYKVGWRNNCWLGQNANSDRGPGIGNNWMGEVRALGEFDSAQNSNVDIDPDWTNDKSADGLGGSDGDYRPGASTELITIPSGLAPFSHDLNGAALADDGSDYVGALQSA